MERFNYKWVSYLDNGSFEELELSNEDDNWFKTEDEAIAFLDDEKQKDELFCDGICLFLLKMYFA